MDQGKMERPLLFGGEASHTATMPEYEKYIHSPEAFFRWLTNEFPRYENAPTTISDLSSMDFTWLWKEYLSYWKDQREEADFMQWVATVWVHHNVVPTETKALARFDLEQLWPEYETFCDSGGHTPERPLSVEELLLLFQLGMRTPVTCLLNAAQPEQPLGRINRHRSLTADKIWEELEAWYSNPAMDRPLVDRPAGISPTSLLVYDGEQVAHVVTAYTIWKNRLHYQDPWPDQSLLCEKNNAAGVKARKSTLLSGGWSISAKEFQRVVFAVFLFKYPL